MDVLVTEATGPASDVTGEDAVGVPSASDVTVEEAVGLASKFSVVTDPE